MVLVEKFCPYPLIVIVDLVHVDVVDDWHNEG